MQYEVGVMGKKEEEEEEEAEAKKDVGMCSDVPASPASQTLTGLDCREGIVVTK